MRRPAAFNLWVRLRAVELDAVGCHTDYPDALPHRSALMRSFRVELLPGYVDGRVYELGQLDTGYVIPHRLTSDRSSGTVITDWGLELPWPDHFVNRDCEPEDIISKTYQDA